MLNAVFVKEEITIEDGKNAGMLGIVVSWPPKHSEIELIMIKIDGELNFQIMPFYFSNSVDEGALKRFKFFLRQKLGKMTRNLDVDDLPITLCNVNINPLGLTEKNLFLARKVYQETVLSILKEKLDETNLKGKRVLWKNNLFGDKRVILFPWEQN